MKSRETLSMSRAGPAQFYSR